LEAKSMTESRRNEPDLFELKMRPLPSLQGSVAVIEAHCHVGGPWALYLREGYAHRHAT
jgi:hypothetical protein